MNALLEGLWPILIHYLTVQPWTPFSESMKKITRVVAWVRFSDLPLQLYHLSILQAMDNIVGRIAKIERNTKPH